MRLRCIALIVTFALGILLAPLAAAAQQAGKVYRNGWLGITSPPVARSFFEVFRQAMRELGWAEGKNIAFEFRFAEFKAERLPELAVEIVRLKVDLIVAVGTPGVQAARQATTTIPIVAVGVTDPVALRLVASLARPGGNVTGLTSVVPEGIAEKQLQLLKEAAPTVSRVAVLIDPANPAHLRIATSREYLDAANALRLKLQILRVGGPEEIESLFQAAARERADGLQVFASPLTRLHRTRIVELAAKDRLPDVYLLRDHVEAGGLLSYGPSFPELYRRAATYVDKILKGAKAAELPVEQPTRYELIINLKTAKALRLTIPPSVLIRADEVIQ